MKRIFWGLAVAVSLLMLVPQRVEATIEPIGSLPEGVVGEYYSQPAAYNWLNETVVIELNAPLPAGLTLSDKVVLSGTPTEPFDGIVNFTAYEANGIGQQITLPLIIRPAPVVSTGKITADAGKITAVGTDYVMVGKVKVRLIVRTTMIKVPRNLVLAVKQYAAYMGMKNTDGSVTAEYIVVSR